MSNTTGRYSGETNAYQVSANKIQSLELVTESAQINSLSLAGSLSLSGSAFANVFPVITPSFVADPNDVTYLASLFLMAPMTGFARFPNGAPRTDTTPTAAELVAQLPGVQAGTVFQLFILNFSTFGSGEDITLNLGTGMVSPLGPIAPILAGTVSMFICSFNDVNPGTEQVAITRIV